MPSIISNIFIEKAIADLKIFIIIREIDRSVVANNFGICDKC